MNWPRVKFESLYAESSRNGLYKSKEFHGEGTRIVNMGELFAYTFIGSQDMQLIRLTDDELSRFSLVSGDLLFARRSLIEEGAGKCVIVVNHDTPMVFESSIIRVRPNQDLCDSRFYYYYFLSPIGRSIIQSIITGVAQKGIRGSELKELIVHQPPIDTQHRIASILSAYDDLIENNNRRIDLLEESMRLLYREWFLRLRFPGHEHVRMVDGLPEGWERKTLGDVIVLNYGKGLKEETRINGGIPVYGSSGIVGYHNEALVSGPAIIVGRKGNVGSVYWSAGDCFPIDTVYFITSEQATPFMYLNLKHQHFVSSDVAVPGLNRNHAYAQPILIPSQKLLNQFNEIIDTIIREIEILKTSSTKLSEARDLLLPRLMSGEIDVS